MHTHRFTCVVTLFILDSPVIYSAMKCLSMRMHILIRNKDKWLLYSILLYMAPHSSTLAWKIPWTEEPGRPQSMGSLESDTTERLHFHFFTFMHWRRQWQPTPGKNTGVGCHFLLQCMKVKSESKVAQSCPTPSDPMDCSLPGFSVHGICQARVLEWVAIAFSL